MIDTTYSQQVVCGYFMFHCGDVMITAMAFQITSPTSVFSTVYSDADQRKHQSSASLAFACEGNSPVTGEFHAQEASNVSIWLMRELRMRKDHKPTKLYREFVEPVHHFIWVYLKLLGSVSKTLTNSYISELLNFHIWIKTYLSMN